MLCFCPLKWPGATVQRSRPRRPRKSYLLNIIGLGCQNKVNIRSRGWSSLLLLNLPARFQRRTSAVVLPILSPCQTTPPPQIRRRSRTPLVRHRKMFKAIRGWGMPSSLTLPQIAPGGVVKCGHGQEGVLLVLGPLVLPPVLEVHEF